MSGKLRERNFSGLTDLARLQDIRRELHLVDPDVDDVFLASNGCTESGTIVQDILSDVLRKVCRHNSGYRPSELKQNRCSTLDDDGSEVLCCLLQAPPGTVDPCGFSCQVLNPLDVPRVTGKHERLISHIIRFAAVDVGQPTSHRELVASIPVAHYIVEPWQEVILKELGDTGRWIDGGEPADIVSIEDEGKFVYGVQLLLKELLCVAVVSRPRTDYVTLGEQAFTVTSSSDPRVKMRVPATTGADPPKQVKLQVVPVDEALLNAFKQSPCHHHDIEITAATSLIAMSLTGQQAETITFITKCAKARREDGKRVTKVDWKPLVKNGDTRPSREGSLVLTPRCSDNVPVSKPVLQTRHGTSAHRLSVSSVSRLSVSSTPRQSVISVPRPTTGTEKRRARDMHLVQLGDDSEVRLKLLDDKERADTPENGQGSVIRFSVYDRNVSLLALETKSGLEYTKVQRLAQSFTDYVAKHKVTLKIGQDIRDVYSVCFSMKIASSHPYKHGGWAKKKTSICPNHLSTCLQIDDGDLVGLVFQGNIDVNNQTQRVYSFHGYRGINKTFDIQIRDSFSQRSLQSFHGRLNVFTLKGSRVGAVDKLSEPLEKSSWQLIAEFPLVLPKYLNKTPVCVNKAPISLRFQEPLTVDFVSKICRDVVEEWYQFARALGISHARTQAIKQQNRNVVSERMLMDLVVCWMKQQPISRDKVPPFLQALSKCGKRSLVAELAQRNDSLSNGRSLALQVLMRRNSIGIGEEIKKLGQQYYYYTLEPCLKFFSEKQLQKAFALICKSKAVTCKWQQILKHLYREDNTDDQLRDIVSAIEAENENEISRCYRALSRWKVETAAPSMWKLVDALRYSHCDVAADSLTVMEA